MQPNQQSCVSDPLFQILSHSFHSSHSKSCSLPLAFSLSLSRRQLWAQGGMGWVWGFIKLGFGDNHSSPKGVNSFMLLKITELRKTQRLYHNVNNTEKKNANINQTSISVFVSIFSLTLTSICCAAIGVLTVHHINADLN